jgi:hypothetical protein
MASFNATSYDIERITGQCAFSGEVLEPKQEYMATLVEIQPDELAATAMGEANADAASDSASKTNKKSEKNKSDKAKPSTSIMEAFGLKRLDVSMTAWDQGSRPDHLFSYWKTIVPTPNEKKQMFVDNDVLLNLLRRLADADQAQRLAFRFVLALILMRKKMLRYDKTEQREAVITETIKEEGDNGEDVNEKQETKQVEQEWWVMTPKLNPAKGPLGKWKDDEIIEVMNPQLDEQQIFEVTEQLNEILNAEL